MSNENENYKVKIKELSDENEKYKETIAYQQKTYEDEVQLRLQFESKLNSLHALNRQS